MVEAVTVRERIAQVKLSNRELQTTIPWICDGIDGEIEKGLGGAPNSEFVFDEKGVLVRKRFWHDPDALRGFLAQRFGEVEEPTTVADLEKEREQKKVPRLELGKVPRLQVPDGMKLCDTFVIREGEQEEQEQVVKLLVEVEPSLLKGEGGKVWLGFFLDPIYRKAWDNRRGELHWELRVDRSDFEPIQGKSPKYEHAEDIDPREFLLDFKGAKKGVTYELLMKAVIKNVDGGGKRMIRERFRFQLTPTQRKARRSGSWMMKIVGDPMSFDRDGNGFVEKKELPDERAKIYLLHYDFNHDSRISKAEVDKFMRSVRHHE